MKSLSTHPLKNRFFDGNKIKSASRTYIIIVARKQSLSVSGDLSECRHIAVSTEIIKERCYIYSYMR